MLFAVILTTLLSAGIAYSVCHLITSSLLRQLSAMLDDYLQRLELIVAANRQVSKVIQKMKDVESEPSKEDNTLYH
jgi:hypothetical protein